MPGRAAQTRADACRPSRAATLPAWVPLRYWLVGGSAVAVSVWVSGFGPGLPSPLSSWGAWSPRPAPDLEERRWAARLWWSHPGGPRRASGWPSLSAPSPPSRLGGRAWRRPASPRAGQDRPAVATTACALRCGAACVVAGTSRPPPAPAPADWVALLFPHFGTSETSGASREAGPRPDSTLLPYLPSLCAWPAAPTSAITRTDLTVVPPTVDVAGPSGWVSGRVCAVRRLVVVPAGGWGRAAGSVGVAEIRARRAGWPGCGRRSRAGWWGR